MSGSLRDAEERTTQTAEKIAKRLSIPRQAQDEYALRSHRLAAAGTGAGRDTGAR